MDQYQTDSRLIGCLLIENIIPITLLVATPKGSALRYLAIPCMMWIVSQMLYPVHSPTYFSINGLCGSICCVFSALDFLLINPKEGRDFVDANGKQQGFFPRLMGASRLFTSPRAFGTPRQAKGTPSLPAYYTEKDPKTIPRARFLTREVSIAVWQFLALDLFNVLAKKEAIERKESGMPLPSGTLYNLTAEQWIELAISNLVGWFIVSRIIISFYGRVVSILFVASGLSPPSECPPMFNTMADSYTLRNFWGKFWHQMLRRPFTAVSNFISRDVLRLPKPSAVERYFNVFLVFLFSGILHAQGDVVKGISLQESGAMSFFLSFVLGYMIEDGVQALWKRTQGARTTAGPPPLWQRAIGFCWVMGWLIVTSDLYFGPTKGRPERHMELIPFSVLDLIGLPVLSSILLAGSVALKIIFKVEV